MNQHSSSRRPRSISAALAVLVLAVLYVEVGPIIGQKLGITLPGLEPAAEADRSVAVDDAPDTSADTPAARPATTSTGPKVDSVGTQKSTTDAQSPRKPAPSTTSKATNSSKSATPDNAAEPAAKPEPTRTSKSTTPTKTSKAGKTSKTASGGGDDLRPGYLKSYGDVKVSPAGLRYTRGSRDGHRLEHVMQHTKDDLDKPVHGVFEAQSNQPEQATVVALIDEAYQRAQTGGRGVSKSQQQGRTEWTIDMNRRIGYMGGQRGKRENQPACYKLRLVLEGKDVITAYPTR